MAGSGSATLATGIGLAARPWCLGYRWKEERRREERLRVAEKEKEKQRRGGHGELGKHGS